jgi:hypothetical protein
MLPENSNYFLQNWIIDKNQWVRVRIRFQKSSQDLGVDSEIENYEKMV